MPIQKGNDKIGKDTRFKKGNKASKGHGRPKKLPGLVEIMAEVLGDEENGKSRARRIIDVLAARAEDRWDKDQIKAAAILLDRGYGKPKEFIEQTNKNEVNWGEASEEDLLVVAKLLGEKK